jgi:hypothetical protein
MNGEVALNLVAGSMVGAMHSITRRRMPRDFAEQTAAVREDELATAPCCPSVRRGCDRGELRD